MRHGRPAVERAAPVRFTCGMHLDSKAKMALLEFVCSFAWTDLKIQQQERDLVMRIVGRFNLTADETRRVQQWLKSPPPAEDIDPTKIPREHRQLFLEAAALAVRADGRVVPAEKDQLAVFRDLLGD
jgi:hypothetical protein